MKLHIDVERLIATFGGISQMSRHFTSRGYDLSRSRINQWKSRGQVPMGAWLDMCAAEYEHGGYKLDLWGFFVFTKE